MQHLRKKKRKTKKLISLLMVCAVLLTGAFALLTSTDSKTNKFTVGKVSIEIAEPIWDSENPDGVVENIIPTQTINKDPSVKNTGKNNAFVYIRVWMPKVDNVKVFGETPQEDGSYSVSADNVELFKTIKTTTDDTGKWELVDSQTDSEQAYNYYLYGYTVPLAPNETTGTLFDQIQTINITDGMNNIPSEYQNIVIEGYAIQSDRHNSEMTYSEAWNVLVNQNGFEWPDNPAEKSS